MAFGEAVAAEALDLLEAALGEVARIAARDHAFDQLLLVAADRAEIAEGRHRPAQAVGLRGREARGGDREVHRLLLEQRHAERLLEHIAQLVRILGRAGVFDRFLVVAAAQVGMDHAALDRPGADDRHLDHEIVKLGGLHSREHRDLRAALDLEGADAVALLQHLVSSVIVRDGGEREVAETVLAHQVEALADAGEHAEREHIDLHQPERLDVVLVPLDEGPIGHRAVVDRYHFVEPVLGEHEATDML